MSIVRDWFNSPTLHEKGKVVVFRRYENLLEKDMSEEKESSKELLEIYEKELKQLDETLRYQVVHLNVGLKRQLEIVQNIHDVEGKIHQVKSRL